MNLPWLRDLSEHHHHVEEGVVKHAAVLALCTDPSRRHTELGPICLCAEGQAAGIDNDGDER